ncbi:MAG: glycosyltransferase family 2 protein [Elusimicrobia bacterium]|nr:glycosyltransferase family 2 protein [Elusimicrobiota bacterium]
MLLSVVIPCRDEAGSVARFASELFPELGALGVPWEVVAVDDGSADGTGAALRRLAEGRPNLKVLAHDRGRGLGAALRTGFAGAAGDWIATLDADLTFRPRQLADLLEAQRKTGADLVAGSPFLGGGLSGVPWRRGLPSRLVNAAYRLLCGPTLTAYTPILRLYRTEALHGMRLRAEGFEINAEIAAGFLAAGLKVAEVPAQLATRREGRSKLAAARELRRHAALMLRILLGRLP